ncbi:ABC transporter substrate-binding protein [Actinomadura xylanilytica]|uniref:ABC transporter substrate-binding protein n=1 Tax=Actinomadura xylanilytica TaxID=887459 RepID=UPI00255AEF3C|nr:ABC transporter substrate-binding protein [Actinomadura xylanilytica]MDL4770583.1 ABC transporter substrate-binding protein [Actinomadura xylanilytica]
MSSTIPPPSACARRRIAVLAAGLLALTLGLTACGDGDGGASGGGETRTVVDATGAKVEVPAAPKRVVALNETDLDSALALGVQPVGVTNGRFAKDVPGYLKTRLTGDYKIVGDLGTPVLEKVAQARPDLILAGFIADQKVIEQLRKITPATVLTTKMTEDWKATFTRTAEVLGKPAQGGTVLAGYDARVKKVKEGLGAAAGATVSIVRWNATGPSYMLKDHFSSLVIRDLGLNRPAGQLTPAGFSPSDALSLENLTTLDGDWMFLGTLNPDSDAALAEARKIPAFTDLGVVRAGHVVNVDGAIWTSRGGPAAAGSVLGDVEKALAPRR